MYCLSLALPNSYLIDKICKKERKKGLNESQTSLSSRHSLKEYYHMIEDTLLFHLWLKKKSFFGSHVEVKISDMDSKASE